MYYIIGVGEVLWDMFPEGKKLGGAPANFLFHAQQLGAKIRLMSAIGNDKLGQELQVELEQKQIPHDLNISSNPTGTVKITVNHGTPAYQITEGVAWDFIPEIIPSFDKIDVVYFGTLAQRNQVSKQLIWQFLEQVSTSTLKVFDCNLRQNYYDWETIYFSLKQANIVKLSQEELTVIAQFKGYNGFEDTVNYLLNEFNIQLLAITCAEEGSWLFSETEKSFVEAQSIKVQDTVGAGDSFTATITMGWLQQKSLTEIHHHASQIASFVCENEGATPDLPPSLKF